MKNLANNGEARLLTYQQLTSVFVRGTIVLVRGNTVGSRILSLDNEKLAYIAGFLDGDGCVTINFEKSKTCQLGYRVRVRISFTQHSSRLDVLKVIYSWIDSGVIAEYEHNWMAEYVIRNQEDVRELLIRLLPYLIVKKQHAEISLKVLQLKEERYSTNSLEQMRQCAIILRSLNHYPKRKYLDPVTTEA